MTDIVNVAYHQTGKSIGTDANGMREMQARAFEYRKARRLLIKAPPASGKSRALMFLALDKLIRQGVRKVVIAVPESSIGSSFSARKLTETGFFADWAPDVDLTSGLECSGKVQRFLEFMDSEEKILICTHATFRFACEQLEAEVFKDCLVAIDEFHHVSADADSNRLGSIVREMLNVPEIHLIAMTGSYFRGDSVPVLRPEDEESFEKCTYSYYEQLNGYEFLKTLGIGYHFYEGSWLDVLGEVLDTDRKTILHIPNVNSRESTKDKWSEVGEVLDSIGDVVGDSVVPQSNVLRVRRKSDGKMLLVADLVDDHPVRRRNTVEYLRNIRSPEEMDLIIALGMAKEGFDWPFCEHTLTVGYRGSLTEVVQIIGRCTRDSSNKTHAQFTNLIPRPVADRDETAEAVNNMLKAITCSLLMEQVLAPNFKFQNREPNDTESSRLGEIKIRGFKAPSTERTRKIIESDLNDLKAAILQDADILKTLPGAGDSKEAAEFINRTLIPRVIQRFYPDLDPEETEEVRQYVVADSFVKNGQIDEEGDLRFIRAANRFINIEELSIDLIDSINPFQKAWEILSKTLDKRTFRLIQECCDSTRVTMPIEEAVQFIEAIKAFVRENGREPDFHSWDPYERRLGEALLVIRKEMRRQNQESGK